VKKWTEQIKYNWTDFTRRAWK